MVKLTDGTRTCSCKIQANLQGFGADYRNERLYLLDEQERQVATIAYIRGLENHPLRGTNPDIQEALRLLRRTNTRRPPDTLSSSEESATREDEHETEEDSSGPCHGFSTPTTTDSDDQGPELDNQEEAQPQEPDIAEEDRPTYEWILAIIQGAIPAPEPPEHSTRRPSSTRDDWLETDAVAPGAASARNQEGAPTQARRHARTPPRGTSSEEDSPPRMKLRSHTRKTRMKPPKKKEK